MAEPIKVPFYPSENQEAFIRSTALENCFMGPRGEGKDIPYETELITQLGVRTAKQIEIGDQLYSIDGTSTTVLGVYPQPGKQQWRLKFSDGTSAVSSEDHLWVVETTWDRDGGAESDTRYRFGTGRTTRRTKQKASRKRRGRKLVRTKDIVDSIRAGKRWSIPLTSPVLFPGSDLNMSPYLLGVLLGDGSLNRKPVMLTTADGEILMLVRDRLPSAVKISKVGKYEYTFTGDNYVTEALTNLGLSGHRSWEKFVPHKYLWAQSQERLALLQGLLDTDGTVSSHSNSVSFSSASPRLANDVAFLVRSLGGIAKQRTRKTTFVYKGKKKEGRLSHIVSVNLPNGIQPFKLSRKAERVSNKGSRNIPRRYIVGVEYVGINKGVCFKVDHPSELFLLHDFIPTHNTDGGIMAMIYHASLQDKQYRPIPWAVVRDTWTNLQRTTYRSFMYPTCPTSLAYQLRQAGRLKERDGGRQISMVDKEGKQIWIAFLFGMDTPDDLNQLLSMQLGGLWVEEAAPAMQGDIGKGISEEIWTLGITSLRHTLMSDKAVEFLKEWEGKYKQMTPTDIKQGLLLGAMARTPYGDFVPRNRRAQVTMNYPSEDHWTWVRFYEETDPARALFRIPRGENEHVDNQYRENMLRSLEGRQDLLDRLVIGRPAHVQLGVAVTPEYHESYNGGPWHRSSTNLDPMPTVPVFRFWDGDLHPAPYSQDTEILTESGWKLIKDTLIGEEAITLNPITKEIEYQPITNKLHSIHSGKMINWKGQNYDLRVTEDHMVPYILSARTIQSPKVYLSPALELVNKKVMMLKAGVWVGGLLEKDGYRLLGRKVDHVFLPAYKSDKKYFKSLKEVKINIDTFCAFMGLYLSEGSCEVHDDHYQIDIWQMKDRSDMAKVIAKMPFKWRRTWNSWNCCSVQLYYFLKQFGKAHEKYVPQFMKFLPPRQLRIFLNHYIMGDGTDGRRIYTTSKHIVNDVQEIALKCGVRATYRISKDVGDITKIKGVEHKVTKPQYVINLSNSIKKPSHKILSMKTATVENVTGEHVYCVTVLHNHIIYVRRNGKPMWGGNCFFAQITPRGKFIGLDTLRGPDTGMGMKQFIDRYVKPLMANRYSKVRMWRDLGDPTLNDRDPSDSSKTAAQMIEKELNTQYEGGVLRFGPRKEAMKELLTRTLSDGEPMFVLSKHEKIMHRSLSGGWHYNKTSSGKVSEEPDNNDPNSHPASALSHGLAKIFKYARENQVKLPASRKRIAISSSVQPLYQRR